MPLESHIFPYCFSSFYCDLFVSTSFTDLSKDTANMVVHVSRIDLKLDLLLVNKKIANPKKEPIKKQANLIKAQ